MATCTEACRSCGEVKAIGHALQAYYVTLPNGKGRHVWLCPECSGEWYAKYREWRRNEERRRGQE